MEPREWDARVDVAHQPSYCDCVLGSDADSLDMLARRSFAQAVQEDALAQSRRGMAIGLKRYA